MPKMRRRRVCGACAGPDAAGFGGMETFTFAADVFGRVELGAAVMSGLGM